MPATNSSSSSRCDPRRKASFQRRHGRNEYRGSYFICPKLSADSYAAQTGWTMEQEFQYLLKERCKTKDRRGLKSKCAQPHFIIRTGNRFTQALDDLPLLWGAAWVWSFIHIKLQWLLHRGKRSYLAHLHNPNTVGNLRYACIRPSRTTLQRGPPVSLYLFLPIDVYPHDTEVFSSTMKHLHVHYQAEEEFNSHP